MSVATTTVVFPRALYEKQIEMRPAAIVFGSPIAGQAGALLLGHDMSTVRSTCIGWLSLDGEIHVGVPKGFDKREPNATEVELLSWEDMQLLAGITGTWSDFVGALHLLCDNGWANATVSASNTDCKLLPHALDFIEMGS